MTHRDRVGDPSGQAGFTLIELLVVLLIMGVLIALAPAAFQRVVPGLEMKASAREVAGLLREARGQAIRDNRETAVLIDTAAKVYRLGQGGTGHELSARLDISLVTAASERLDEARGRILFFPDGTSTGGRVTLSRDDRKFDITVDWLTGLVAISE
jgi:general secretion pathway protein H